MKINIEKVNLIKISNILFIFYFDSEMAEAEKTASAVKPGVAPVKPE